MMLGYKSNKNVVYSSKYHIVWCPKYRRKVLAGGVEKRLLELTHKAAARYQAEASYRLAVPRSEEHTSELQSHSDLVCRLLLEKKKKKTEKNHKQEQTIS